jgi:DNA-3-methyladenine glycosylase I
VQQVRHAGFVPSVVKVRMKERGTRVKADKSLDKRVRCDWANTDELLKRYHDEEWGVPVHNDRLLFEMLNLEGAQAGLSWLTVLKKREGYLRAFDSFNAAKIANYDAAKKAKLLKNASIIRNRLKINAVTENARAFLLLLKQFESFDKFIWQYVDGEPLTQRDRKKAVQISERMSKELKKRGFRFVGPTICFAFMQAIGMINDHTATCFRAKEV